MEKDGGREACPAKLDPNENPGWLGREPTGDEQEVVAWIKAHFRATRLLHVGVGNSLMFLEFGRRTTQGITKDGGEAAHARALGLEVLLCNKYDIASYAPSLRSPFDCIVDVNIRSYACCDRHFRDYMRTMLDSLAPNGILLTSIRGLDYLVPTSLTDLRRLCPDWTVRHDQNVVVMRPGLAFRLRRAIGRLRRR
jgi:hypothetical protein